MQKRVSKSGVRVRVSERERERERRREMKKRMLLIQLWVQYRIPVVSIAYNVGVSFLVDHNISQFSVSHLESFNTY